MAKFTRERVGMGAVNLLAPTTGGRRLGEDAMDPPSDPLGLQRPTGAPATDPLILGLFTPMQAVLGIAAAWFLLKK